MIRIYSNDCKDFNNNGLGILLDFKTSPKITESLNGNFELNFDYAIKGKNVEHLIVDNIIKAPYDGKNQLFRIKKVKPNLSKINIYAAHIFYDLSENFLVDVAPTQKNAVNAISWLLEHAMFKTNFSITGDTSAILSARYVRKNIVDAILGADNCIVKKWGGEIERDNFNIIYHCQRGADRGVRIKQGKNIKEVELEIDFTSVVTRIIPQGANELLLPEIYVDSPIINTYRNPIVAKYEFNDIAVDDNTTEDQAYELLREAAKKLFSDDNIDKPTISVKVNWLELSKTEEYKNYSNLEYVRLGDTVTVQALGYEYKIRVIKVVYDCLLNTYTSFEIGDPKADFVSNTVDNIATQIQQNSSSILQQAKQMATALINNGFGGNVRIYPDRILIMDTDNEATAKNVWQWNLNGFGHSSTGIDGKYETAITIDGQIVANSITTGKMSAERIEGLNQILLSLKEKDIELQLGQDNISSKVSESETIIRDITTTTQTSIGKKYLYLLDALGSIILEYIIYGKSEQDVTFQQESDNLFDINLWKNGKIGVNQGNIVIDDNSITMSNPTAKDQYNTGTFHGNATPTEDQINIVKKYGIEVTPSTLYTLSYDNENSTLSQCFIFWYDENYVYISNANLYSADARCVLTANSSINAKYATIRFDNEGYETEQTELKISKISFKIGKDGTYSKFVSPKPSPNYSSEIESVRGIENLFDKNNPNIIDGKYLNTTGYETSNSGFCITQYIPIEQGKYTYSGLTVKPEWAAKMCLYDANKTFLSYKDQTSSEVLTIDSKAKYIRFSFYKEEKESFMLERGKVAHKYVPYGNWLIIKQIGANILNYNGTYSKHFSNYYSFVIDVPKYALEKGKTYYFSVDVQTINNGTANSIRFLPQTSISYSMNRINSPTLSKDIQRYVFSIVSNEDIISSQIAVQSDNASSSCQIQFTHFMISEENIPYEPYKEQEILIDMAKKSLFDGIFSQGFISAQGVEGVVENQIYTPNYIKVQPNTKYIYSNDQNIKINYIALYDNDKQFLKRISCNAFEYTTDSDTYYIRFTNYNGSKIIPEDVTNASLLEAGDNYYELASLSDEDNIFDGIFEQGLIGQNGSINSSNTQQIYTLNYIPVNQNSRYVYSNDQNQKVNYLAKYDKNKNFIERVACSSSVFITDSSTYYIRFTNYIGSGITPDYITNATLVERKYDLPMPNIKDTLKIENGQAILTKNMGKYVFTGDEDFDADSGTVGVDYRHAIKISKLNIPQPNYGYRGNAISSHFIGKASNTEEFGSFYISSSWCVFTDKNKLYDLNGFKQFLKEQYNNGTPVTVYYVLEEPYEINLSISKELELFTNINNITFIDKLDIQPTVRAKYLRNTPLSYDYATNQRVDNTDKNVFNNQNQINNVASDLNDTNTNLYNNYYNKEQVDYMKSTTEEQIVQIKNTVETNTTATNLQISVLEEKLINGVTSVKTETGYIFDKDGLKIGKSDSEMNLLLDNDGLAVKRNNDEVLTVRSSGVETENLKVRTYFHIGSNTRVEDYKEGTGFFHIGEW